MAYNTLMILDMLRWWYGTGWMQTMHRVGTWTSNVEHAFSIGDLFKTLFAPWRRITSSGGRSIDAKMHDAMDNFVSRCVGFSVRSIALIAAAVAGLATIVAGIAMVIIWPLLPIAAVYFLVRGIIG